MGKEFNSGKSDKKKSKGSKEAPFANPKAQDLFTTWCNVNDPELAPQFLGRRKFLRKEKPGLPRRADGKSILRIPIDADSAEIITLAEKVTRSPLTDDLREDPERALRFAIFERGAERISRKLGENGWSTDILERFNEQGLDITAPEKTLHNLLGLVGKKYELDSLREAGDMASLVEKEHEVADEIQQTISSLPYQTLEGSFPTRIVDSQFVNCVGATVTGIRLLRQVGIDSVVIGEPNHSATLRLTSDGKIYRQDFLENPGKNQEILGDNQELREKIFALSKNFSEKEIVISPEESGLNGKITVTAPGFGEYSQVLGNIDRVLMKKKKYETAIFVHEKFEEDPKNRDFYLDCLYLITGRAAECSQKFMEGKVLTDEKESFYQSFGYLLDALQRDTDALAALRSVVERERPELYKYAGDIFKNSQPEIARIAYEEALVLNPQDTALMKSLAHCYMDQGENYSHANEREKLVALYSQAIPLLQEVINANPNVPENYLSLADSLYMAGREEDALVVCEEILLLIDPKKDQELITWVQREKFVINTYLGMSYSQEGLYDKSLGSFQTAYELFPEDEKLNRYFSSIIEMLGKYPEKITKWRDVVRGDPRYMEILRHAEHYFAQNWTDARYSIPVYTEASALRPDDISPHLHLFVTYDSMNRHSEAIHESNIILAMANPVRDKYVIESITKRRNDLCAIEGIL